MTTTTPRVTSVQTIDPHGDIVLWMSDGEPVTCTLAPPTADDLRAGDARHWLYAVRDGVEIAAEPVHYTPAPGSDKDTRTGRERFVAGFIAARLKADAQ